MSEVPGVQGWVFAMVEWDPDGPGPREPVLVVGGQIGGAGNRAVSRIAVWDGAAWSDELGAIMGPDLETGGAYALLVHNGDLFAGTAEVVDSAGASHGGVFHWAGSGWDRLGNLVGDCLALAEFDGGIAAAGHFAIDGGQPADQVAVWDGAAWSTLGTFVAPSGMGTAVQRLAVVHGQLTASGSMVSAGGNPVAGAAAWNGTSWDDLGLPAGAQCFGVVANDQAEFASVLIGPYTQPTFELLRRDNGAWVQDANPFPNQVGLFALGNDLYLGAQGLAHLVAGTWEPIGAGLEGWVTTLATFRGALAAGGSLGISGLAAKGVATWDGSAWHATGHGIDGEIRSLVVWRDQLYAAGYGLRTESVPGSNVLRWTGSGWEAVSGLGATPAMVVYQDSLVLWGGPASHLVRFDGVNITDIGPFDTNTELTPYVLDGTLYATGDLARSIHRLDADGWTRLDGPLALQGFQPLGLHNGQLYAYIDFDVPEYHGNYLGRWTGSSWELVGWGPMNTDMLEVYTLTEFSGQLIIGGWFDWIDAGQYATYSFATLTDDGWDLLQGAPRVGGVVKVMGPNMLVSSYPDYSDHAPLVSWNGSTWRTVTAVWNGPSSTVGISDFVEFEGDLVVAGQFSSINGTPAYMVARGRVLPCCGSADFDGDGQVGTDADIQAFFACLAGNCCSSCGSADFNDDGDVATDADIEAFFRVLAGGSC